MDINLTSGKDVIARCPVCDATGFGDGDSFTDKRSKTQGTNVTCHKCNTPLYIQRDTYNPVYNIRVTSDIKGEDISKAARKAMYEELRREFA